MKKSDKKIERALIQALEQVCEHTLDEQLAPGFEWLTHSVNFKQFSHSLMITCVFDTHTNSQQATRDSSAKGLAARIISALAQQGIVLAKPKLQIQFDNEANCAQQHNGNWALRLQRN